MLYKRKNEAQLDPELFRSPTSEYRGAPFWAWNAKLDKDELLRQLTVFKEMGFGGAHMHVRTGLATPYLSDEYMALIRACVDKCGEEGLHAYLYDEDRWPSGAAGGMVTKDRKNRARYLLFTPVPYESGAAVYSNHDSRAETGRTEKGTLIACFDIELTADGYLRSWAKIPEEAEAAHTKWWAYEELTAESPWFNDQTYVNTLDKKAIERFIETTHERYKEVVSDEFDRVIPSIFTDEPQVTAKHTLKFADERADVTLPWTDDLPETFRNRYQEDLVAGIPELIWDRADGNVSTLRYHYHDHVCERFTEAFADTIGGWCRKNGIALTGHMMEEPTLKSQTVALGEAMRAYRGFDIPGIDMLCARFEYTTAKQAQSAVHQFGYEGMTSELYGVTNWDFDFRGHKLHGDWQAALGVTLRVPHLSWYSMAGEAKRDYPASIFDQSPWWKEYRRVEDHFARVNTAMTRGKALVKVGVIHPIESYWLHWGPAESTALVRDEMDRRFQTLTEDLLFGSIDFDFISESLLPDQCPAGGAPLAVGEMAYDTILVPGMETIRSTTLERLEAFRDRGGKLVFLSPVPTLVDAEPSDRAEKLAKKSLVIPASRSAVLGTLEEDRLVELRDEKGMLTENLLYQLRADGDERWLFIAHGKEPYNKDVSRFQNVRIRVRGAYRVVLYDTMTGEIRPLAAEVKNGRTSLVHKLYDYDSLLLRLIPAAACTADGTVEEHAVKADAATGREAVLLPLPTKVAYTLSEPNALLLDQAEYALDDEPYHPSEEILRLDNILRARLGWPGRKDAFAQPWVVPAEPPVHSASLRFRIFSEIPYEKPLLAVEDAEKLNIRWNGSPVENAVTGWYVDRAIRTVALPKLQPGENVLELKIPFGRRTNIEWCYLLGNFGVSVHGRDVRVTALPEKLGFGDITSQGLPFYGGNICYWLPVTFTSDGELIVRSSRYRGALQTVRADGGEEVALFLPPYAASLPVKKETKELTLTLYGNRRNSFGPVHLADLEERWIGPNAWRSIGDCWCYDYVLAEEGVLATPELILLPETVSG